MRQTVAAYTLVDMNNIPKTINEKRSLKLHQNKLHTVCQLKEKIQCYFHDFTPFDDLNEVVSIKGNFDELLMPQDHPARSTNDTYYVDSAHVLRTQTSAHQNELLRGGYKRFIVTGDVYRKDTIDRTHYPVFHQMEVVKVLPKGSDALSDLKSTLSGLIAYLYPGKDYRFLDDSFPFTEPSVQIEVYQNEDWMEVLGAGVIHPKILENCNIEATGWAFGLGLDRLVLSYCDIPDIRYLWTTDERFIKQFNNGLAQFQEYSKYPPVFKDISFWVNGYTENKDEIWSEYNNFCEIIREEGLDLVEDVTLQDKFQKEGRTSLSYRIAYRSGQRTLSNEEINLIQEKIRTVLSDKFEIILR
ncbi:Phenylalanine--tRNA ligase alpha subunit [compost metagenome]